MCGESILIVEDEGVTGMLLKENLQEMGYRALAVLESGEAAVERTLDGGVRPDLILMDICLKGPMDGIDAAAAIRAELDIPIVYLTAHSDEKTLERAKQTLPYGYLVKPFHSNELHSTVRMALHKHKLEREMRENRDELRLIASAVKDAIVASDGTDRILFWNRGAEVIFGYSEWEIYHKPLTELMPPKYRRAHENGMARVNETSRSALSNQVLELEGMRKDGELFPMEMSLSSWVRADRRFFAAVIRDISERKRLEDQERYAAFQSGVAEMSVAILHNIGNAIMGIAHRADKVERSSAELDKIGGVFREMRALLQKKRGAGQSDQRILADLEGVLEEVGGRLKRLAVEVFQGEARVINEGVRHISEIIELHQDAAHPKIHVTRFPLLKLLENAVAIQRDTLDKYGVRVTLEAAPDVGEVSLPRNQLLQLMINLIKNSREAIQQRGNGKSGDGRIRIIARRSHSGLEILVHDNGCGVDPKNLESIFRYGYTTKERGAGFGLHSAANFIQSLGGTIQARSAGIDQGTDILLTIPESRSEESA